MSVYNNKKFCVLSLGNPWWNTIAEEVSETISDEIKWTK